MRHKLVRLLARKPKVRMPRVVIWPLFTWTEAGKRSSLVLWKGPQGRIKSLGFNFSSATKFFSDFYIKLVT